MIATQRNTLHRGNESTTLVSKILVPVDFSTRCADAADFAVKLAQRFHAKVILLHVERFFGDGSYGTTEDARWLKEQMAKFLPKYVQDPNVWRTIHLNPEIADEILSTAIGIRADLIVMPTHGYGTFRRALLGSVTARVLRDAPCPVLTTAHPTSPEPAVWANRRRILCAVDSLPEGTTALSWASKLASELNAELCVAWSEKAHTELRDEIDELRLSYPIGAETVIKSEKAPDALRRATEEMRAGLVIISRNTENASPESKLDIYHLVRESPCPVVSI